jgi:hypothetical protein
LGHSNQKEMILLLTSSQGAVSCENIIRKQSYNTIFEFINTIIKSSEYFFYALLITQIPKNDYTDFPELSINYVPV